VDRSEKQQLIATLHETLKTAELVVVTQQSGLTVRELAIA
jgi:ribosomal protein L10